jgi:biopolymer transport protein ExbB
VEWFEKGGIFMWPLLAESIAALYFIIERSIFFMAVLPRYRRNLMETCESDKVKTGADGNPDGDPLVRELLAAKRDKSLNLESVDIAIEEHLRIPQHGLTGINIIAQTAPLLGLLGTITGLIRAFIQIQNLQGQVNPSDLAGGIWEALITTAAGLCIAIPCVIAYLHFTRQVAKHETWLARAVAHVEKVFRRMGWEVI